MFLLGLKTLVIVKFKDEQRVVKVSGADKLSEFLDEGNVVVK